MSSSEIIFKPYPIPYPPVLPITPPVANPTVVEANAPITPINVPTDIELEEDSIPSSSSNTTPITPSIKRNINFLTPLKPFKPPTFLSTNKSAQNTQNKILRPPISNTNIGRVNLNLPKLPNLFSPITPSTSNNKIITPSNSNSNSNGTLNRSTSTSKKRPSNSNDQIPSTNNNSKKPKRLHFSPPTFLSSSPSSSTSPSISTNHNGTTAGGVGGGGVKQIPSIELTTLERRRILLIQALKYQEAEFDDLNYRDEDGLTIRPRISGGDAGGEGGGGGGLNSDRKLRELNKKWKEVGKAAIELLWDHANSLTDFNDSNPFFNNSNSFLNNNNNSNTTSWGFSSPPSSSPSSSSTFSNNISTSWGWSTSTTFSSEEQTPTLHSKPSSSFLNKLKEESKESGKTSEEILDELIKRGDGDDLKDLISVDSFWEGVGKRLSGRKGRKVLEKGEEEEEEEEEDVLMKELEESCRGLSDEISFSPPGEIEDINMVEDDQDREEERGGGGGGEEAKMNLGKFMRNIVGINPELFGWNDEEEEFI